MRKAAMQCTVPFAAFRSLSHVLLLHVRTVHSTDKTLEQNLQGRQSFPAASQKEESRFGLRSFSVVFSVCTNINVCTSINGGQNSETHL
jgi:hypothetical protein